MHCMAVALGKESDWRVGSAVGVGEGGIESRKSHAKFAYD